MIKSITKKLPLLALLLFTSCFTTAERMYLPDGTWGYRINCDAYMGTTTNCLQRAGDVCGANGYTTYDQTGHIKSDEQETSLAIATVNNGGKSDGSGSSNSRSSRNSKTSSLPRTMFIKCKGNNTAPQTMPISTPPGDTAPIPLHDGKPN